MKNPGKWVWERLHQDGILVAPGAHDVLTAKIIEKTGFEAVYMTGYGNTASILGCPDVGLITFSEMVERARNMAAAVDIPVIADADTGYGNAVNVIRTTKAYEQAGVAVMQLEDQRLLLRLFVYMHQHSCFLHDHILTAFGIRRRFFGVFDFLLRIQKLS